MDKDMQVLLDELESESSNSDCKWQAAAVIRELLAFRQAVLDPENQPSQWGTVLVERLNANPLLEIRTEPHGT